MRRRNTHTRLYDHPPERVWQAISTPELVRDWLMEGDVRPEVGHEFTFRTDPAPGFNGVVRCRVLEADAPRRLAYTWTGGLIDTRIEFTIEPHERGARLRVVHGPFTGPRAVLVSLLLALGGRVIYAKRLPAVLDAMRDAGGEGVDRALHAVVEQDCAAHVGRNALASIAALGAGERHAQHRDDRSPAP